MTFSVEDVLKPARLAYRAGRPLGIRERLQVRDAVLTITHEAKHLIHEFGDENAPDAAPVTSIDVLALEEGLVETWALRHVDAVIQDIEMDRAVPNLLSTMMFDSCPADTAAADELVRGIAQVSGLSPDHVRVQLERTPMTQRWGAIADVVIDKRLGDVMPPDHRGYARTQLVLAMRPQFAEITSAQQSGVQSDDDDMESSEGRHRAERTVTALSTTLAGIENHYGDWNGRPAIAHAAQQAPAVDLDAANLLRFLGGQTPPTGAAVRTSQGSGAAPDSLRQLRPRGSHGQSVE